MRVPQYIRIRLSNCPRCGAVARDDYLPVPFGGVNYKCPGCGHFTTIESHGFTDEGTRLKELREARKAKAGTGARGVVNPRST